MNAGAGDSQMEPVVIFAEDFEICIEPFNTLNTKPSKSLCCRHVLLPSYHLYDRPSRCASQAKAFHP